MPEERVSLCPGQVYGREWIDYACSWAGSRLAVHPGLGIGTHVTTGLQTDASRDWMAREFMALAATAVVVTLIVFRSEELFGRTLIGVTFGMSLFAYAVTILERRWLQLTGAIALASATAISAGLAAFTGVPWSFGVVAFLTLLVVWVPWPTLNETGSTVVLWALAVAPVAMLLMGPPLGDISWAEPLLTGERLHGEVGYNEIGIPAGLSVLAVLALRLRRDGWALYALEILALVLLAGAGTRVVLPGLAVAGLLWIREAPRYGAWRGWALEVLPALAFVLVAIRPMFVRTIEGAAQGGVDGATSGRLDILLTYWEQARTSLLTGKGVGVTQSMWLDGEVDTTWLPHNGIMTLLVDVGILGAIIVLVGLTAYVWIRAAETDGGARWLLRVPLLVFLPALFMLDHGLVKPFLTVPIMIFSAATPVLSRRLDEEKRQYAPRRDRTATTVLPSRNRS